VHGVTVTVELNGVNVPVTLTEEALGAIAAQVQVLPTAVSPYMSVLEAAEYLRCSRQRIYDLLSARRLTRHKDGRRPLILRSELEQYVQESR
jgi:excisionase family DNA binding protein